MSKGRNTKYYQTHQAQICASARKYYAKHKKVITAQKRAKYSARSPKEIADKQAYNERWRTNNPDRMAAKQHRYTVKKMGLTVESHDEMLAKQGGKCAICQTATQGRNKYLAIDHDHQTGKVRGLLCHNCNVMLGHAHNNPATLEAGGAYLRLAGG